jgi:hypothetical protein
MGKLEKKCSTPLVCFSSVVIISMALSRFFSCTSLASVKNARTSPKKKKNYPTWSTFGSSASTAAEWSSSILISLLSILTSSFLHSFFGKKWIRPFLSIYSSNCSIRLGVVISKLSIELANSWVSWKSVKRQSWSDAPLY